MKPINSKMLFIVAGTLTVSTAFLLWQQFSLERKLGEGRQQCESKVAALFDTYEVGTKENAQFASPNINLTTKPELASTKVATKIEDAHDDTPKLQKFDESLEDIVKRKYRFLLARLNISSSAKEELILLLVERERIALQIQDAEKYKEEVELDNTDIANLKYELADLDERIELILGSDDSNERYTLLKDSDSEQQEFSLYTLGIDGLFPLNQEQQEGVLLARLKHKQKFEESISATGFDMDYPLTQMQRDKLIDELNVAVNSYKEGFLDDVRPQLDHDNFPMDQYTLLENYTNTEFKALIDSLSEQVDSRGLIPN